MSYRHHSERTLPKGIHGHIYRQEPKTDNKHGDIIIKNPDGTIKQIIASEDAPSLSVQPYHHRPKKSKKKS